MKHTVLFTGHILGRAVLEVILDWPEPVNGTNTAQCWLRMCTEVLAGPGIAGNRTATEFLSGRQCEESLSVQSQEAML